MPRSKHKKLITKIRIFIVYQVFSSGSFTGVVLSVSVGCVDGVSVSVGGTDGVSVSVGGTDGVSVSVGGVDGSSVSVGGGVASSLTITLQLADLPYGSSAVTVIVAVPTPIAITFPEASTVAIALSEEL